MAKKKQKKKIKKKKSTRTRKPRLISLDDVWPQERDYIERPERLRYVRKLIPEEGCVFCKAGEAGVSFESLSLYSDENIMILLNKYPYNSGHCMVIPRGHVGDLLDLNDEVYSALNEGIRNLVRALKEEYAPAGFNIGLNNGKVAGAGIPEHMHWHVIPRWTGDTNFFPLIAETKVLPESLEQTYKRLKDYF